MSSDTDSYPEFEEEAENLTTVQKALKQIQRAIDEKRNWRYHKQIKFEGNFNKNRLVHQYANMSESQSLIQ